MIDRDKVIDGLKELCEYLFHEYKVCYHGDAEDTYNRFLIADNALELLKEQEPRVLTLDEADAAEVVWFEARNHIFIEPMLTRGQRLADEAEDWFQYGRDWRCWSARPSDKQREEAPWDDITG